jgi:hypothetical protein
MHKVTRVRDYETRAVCGSKTVSVNQPGKEAHSGGWMCICILYNPRTYNTYKDGPLSVPAW